MSKIKVTFSAALTSVTNGEKETITQASTLRETLVGLADKYGTKFTEKIFDQTGRPKKFINFYVNGKDTRFLSGLETQLKDGDEISILPAVSGG